MKYCCPECGTESVKPKAVQLVHTITEKDIGRSFLKSNKRISAKPPEYRFDGNIMLSGFMGPIQPLDVGKRIYHDRRTGSFSVENQEQLERRKK